MNKTKESYKDSNINTSNNQQQAKQEGERNEEDEPRAIKMAKGLQRHREKSNHKANNKIKR